MMRFLKADCDLPWLCIGDLNEVLRVEEQFGPKQRDMAQINLFREAVDVCQLCDLGYIGLDWNFERKVNNGEYCRVRIDRALATADWCAMFPMATVRHLSAVKSDHMPLLLMNHMEAHNQRIAVDRPFRYETMWERHEEFLPLLEEAWSKTHAGSVSELAEKLREAATTFLSWGTATFGAVRHELRKLRKRLVELRAVVGRVGPSYEELKVE